MKGGNMRKPDVEKTTSTGAEQRIFRYKNGYGASVVRGPYTYGGSQGLFELAVIRFIGEDTERSYDLAYDTPITNDVVGWLSEDDVQSLLRRVARLKRR